MRLRGVALTNWLDHRLREDDVPMKQSKYDETHVRSDGNPNRRGFNWRRLTGPLRLQSHRTVFHELGTEQPV